MATFNGVTFTVRREDISRRHAVELSVRHIPGGDRSYIDVAGRQPVELELPVHLESAAELSTFEGMLGQTGQLTYSGGTFTAIIEAATPVRRFGSGDLYATLEFVLL